MIGYEGISKFVDDWLICEYNQEFYLYKELN